MMHKLISFLVGISIAVGAGLWYFFVGSYLHDFYPSDFSYSFELSSSDNFYDEAKGDYLGTQASLAMLTYEATGSVDDVVIIANRFAVRTLAGDPIFSVDREYGVNRVTGEHVEGHGDKNRQGSLFAPPNLQPGQVFSYWHINYDGPALMQFVGEEGIEGLAAYRYQASYDDVVIDQTEQLGHLPGVPEERGVRLEPTLTAWFEPRTGKLLAYQDATIAYYYDQETGEILAPWNSFSNVVTEASRRRQVALVQAEIFILLLQRYGVPAVLAVLGIVVLIHSWLRLKIKDLSLIYRVFSYILAFVVFAGGLSVMFGWFLGIDSLKSVVPGLATMKFSTALSFVASSLVVAAQLRLSRKPSGLASIILPGATLLLFLMMGTLLVATVAGVSSGIDHLFVQESKSALFTSAPGRPSIGTMIGFISIASFGVFSLTRLRIKNVLTRILGSVVIVIGAVALTGYVFSMPALYYTSRDMGSAMAFHTATLFLLLGVTTVLSAKVITSPEKL